MGDWARTARSYGSTTVAALGPEWTFDGSGDFLGDGKSQFLIENTAAPSIVGEVSGSTASYTPVAALGPEWKFVGAGDFLGLGKDQFLIENTSGRGGGRDGRLQRPGELHDGRRARARNGSSRRRATSWATARASS